MRNLIAFVFYFMFIAQAQAGFDCALEKIKKGLGMSPKSTAAPVVSKAVIVMPENEGAALKIVKSSDDIHPSQAKQIITKFGNDEKVIEALILKVSKDPSPDPETLELLKKVQVLDEDTKMPQSGLARLIAEQEQTIAPGAKQARSELTQITGKPIALKNGTIDTEQQKGLIKDLIQKMKGKVSMTEELNTLEGMEAGQLAALIKEQNPNLHGLSETEQKIINALATKYETRMSTLRSKYIELPGIQNEDEAIRLTATLHSMGVDVQREGARVIINARTGGVSKNDDMLRFMLTNGQSGPESILLGQLSGKELNEALFRLQKDQGKIRFKDPLDTQGVPAFRNDKVGLTVDEMVQTEAFKPGGGNEVIGETTDSTWSNSSEIRGGKDKNGILISNSGFSSNPEDTRQLFWPRGEQGKEWTEAAGDELRIAVNKTKNAQGGTDEYIEVFLNTGSKDKDNWVPMVYKKEGNSFVRSATDAKGRNVPGDCAGCHVTSVGRFSPLPEKLAETLAKNGKKYEPTNAISDDFRKQMGAHH